MAIVKSIVDTLNLLKVASENSDYPIYAPFVNFTGAEAQTCNEKVFMSVSFMTPFVGATNIFILSDILKGMGDVQIEDVGENLIINSNGTDVKLPLVDIHFPSLDKPDITMIEVDENMYEQLKEAMKYTNDFAYVCEEGIFATDSNRLFWYDWHKTVRTKAMRITKPMMNVINVGVKIGVDIKENVVIDFGDGYAIFVTDIINKYPVADLLSNASPNMEMAHNICKVENIDSGIPILAPIFFREQESVIKIENNKVRQTDNRLHLIAESEINGRSVYSVECDSEFDFVVHMDINFLRAARNDYDVYYIEGMNDRLYLRRDNTTILLMGMS